MEGLVGALLGLIVGCGVAKIHPRVDGTSPVNLAAGALGGWLGALWWGPDLSAHLEDHSFAGAAAGGAIGAAVLSLVVGASVRFALNRRRRS